MVAQMSRFHDFDPWDVLTEIQQQLQQQQNSITVIANAHNVTQAQVNKLVQLNQHQRQQIRLLQQQIAELALNTQSRDINNG
jgi:phage tail tape-measure protein